MEEQVKYNKPTTQWTPAPEDYKDIILCELSKPKKQESVLEEAQSILNGDRDADYGDAVENFKTIANVASVLINKEITAEECCKVMMAVKIAREGYKHKRDSLVDLASYADILNQIIENDEK